MSKSCEKVVCHECKRDDSTETINDEIDSVEFELIDGVIDSAGVFTKEFKQDRDSIQTIRPQRADIL
ncbi:hypothetical protein QTN25_000669 [Entamoeba marina]